MNNANKKKMAISILSIALLVGTRVRPASGEQKWRTTKDRIYHPYFALISDFYRKKNKDSQLTTHNENK